MTRVRMTRGIVGGALTLTLGLAAISASAAWASPAVKHPVTYKFAVSQVVSAGSVSAIAATDTHGDLYYFSQPFGSSKWHEQVVAKASKVVSFGKPAIAWTGTGVFIAAVDQHGDLVYFVHSAGTWHYHVLSYAPLAGELRWQAPSVFGIPGGGVLVSDGNAGALGALDSWELLPGASQWTEANVAYGNYGASSATVSESTGENLEFITATSGGTVYFWDKLVGGAQWSPQETVAAAGPGISYGSGAVTGTNIDDMVTAPTTTGALDAWYDGDDVNWTEQVVTGSGQSAAHPAIVRFQEVGLRYHTYTYDLIAAVGKGGQLDFWWQLNFGSWTPETIAKAGKQASYTSPSMSFTGTAAIVTATNAKNGNLMFWYQGYGSRQWHTELVAKG
jgi:hypothetical protein